MNIFFAIVVIISISFTILSILTISRVIIIAIITSIVTLMVVALGVLVIFRHQYPATQCILEQEEILQLLDWRVQVSLDNLIM